MKEAYQDKGFEIDEGSLAQNQGVSRRRLMLNPEVGHGVPIAQVVIVNDNQHEGSVIGKLRVAAMTGINSLRDFMRDQMPKNVFLVSLGEQLPMPVAHKESITSTIPG